MPDMYENFQELSAALKEGCDYRIELKDRGSPISIVAPHGGKIELGTSEIACAIASADYNFYAFEGIRTKNNRELHITSHNFDEPSGLKIAQKAQTVLGIHGRRDTTDWKVIYLGGLDDELITVLSEKLKAAGYSTLLSGHKFPAKNKNNICNRGHLGKGAQLEISRRLRSNLICEASELDKFSAAVRSALEE